MPDDISPVAREAGFVPNELLEITKTRSRERIATIAGPGNDGASEFSFGLTKGVVETLNAALCGKPGEITPRQATRRLELVCLRPYSTSYRFTGSKRLERFKEGVVNRSICIELEADLVAYRSCTLFEREVAVGFGKLLYRLLSICDPEILRSLTNRILKLRNPNLIGVPERGGAPPVVKGKISDFDNLVGGTGLVFWRKTFDGDSREFGVGEQQLHRVARRPRFVVLVPVP